MPPNILVIYPKMIVRWLLAIASHTVRSTAGPLVLGSILGASVHLIVNY